MKFNADPKTDGAGEYLKIKDKKSVVGVFRGEPLEYYAKWDGKKSSKCDPTDAKARFRFRVNFIVQESGSLKSLIWEQGPMVYNSLKAINADYNLESHFMKITRHGSGMNDTEYMIMPVPNGALDASKEQMVAAVPLQDLNSGLELNSVQPLPPSTQASDELPF